MHHLEISREKEYLRYYDLKLVIKTDFNNNIPGTLIFNTIIIQLTIFLKILFVIKTRFVLRK